MAALPLIQYVLPWPLTREELNAYRDKYHLIGTDRVPCLGETVMPDGSIRQMTSGSPRDSA